MVGRERLIGLDAGTTGVTAILYDAQLRPLRRAYAEIGQHFPHPAWVEHDAAEIRDTSIRMLREVCEDDFSAVATLGITNQRETVVAFDASSGEPLAPAIVWQCRRTAAMCRELEDAGHADMVREKTGLVLDPYFSGPKIRWLLENDERVRSTAERGDVRFGTIDAWLVHSLTGGGMFLTDHTNASRTMLYDLEKGTWCDELLSLFGVDVNWLPRILDSAGTFGKTDRSVLGAEIPISGILGDQQAALFGQGCFERGCVKSTYGTGAFVLMHTGDRLVRSSEGLLTTVAADRFGRRAFALEGSVFVAGAAIQWLRDALGMIDTAAETEDIARTLDGNDGVYLVPAFAGLGAPWWDPDARGVLCGLTRGAGKAHVVRAALESIAFQTRDLLVLFEKDTGIQMKELRVDGGASMNGFLMQFQADLAGIPVTRGADLDTTAKGAAAISAVGAGILDDPSSAAGLAGDRTEFQGTMDDLERDRLIEGWHHAVARSRGKGR